MGSVNLTGSKQYKTQPNVVPLCDILLVLLIIFMVVTPMLVVNAHVALPEASQAEVQPDPRHMLMVSIRDNGTVYLDLEEVPDLAKLAALIRDKIEEKKQPETGKLLLRADGNIPYGRVTQVMAEIQRSQIEIVGLVTRQRIATE